MIMTAAALCVALNVYHEAKFQGYDGMAAVAVVVNNRVKQNGTDHCKEVFRPYAFSWANPLTTVSPAVRIQRAKRYLPKESNVHWQAAKVIGWQAVNGKLSTEISDRLATADHYFAPKLVNPRWKDKMTLVTMIKDHHFYASK